MPINLSRRAGAFSVRSLSYGLSLVSFSCGRVGGRNQGSGEKSPTSTFLNCETLAEVSSMAR